MTTTAVQPIATSAQSDTPESPVPRNGVITWFEIPAADLERAVSFYERSFGIQMHRDPNWSGMAIFPYEQPTVSGCLVESKEVKPAADGVTVYLNCDGKLDNVLDRLAASGGSILEPKHHLPGIGWVAQMRDSEGNRVGLHAVL